MSSACMFVTTTESATDREVKIVNTCRCESAIDGNTYSWKFSRVKIFTDSPFLNFSG